MRIGGVRINVLLEEKSFIYSTLWILTLSLSSAYFLSLSCGFMILVAFFGSMVALALIIETQSGRVVNLPNFFHKWTPVRWHEAFSCQECSGIDCTIHINSSETWRGIRVPEEIDAALEKAIEGLLQTYVNDWYTSLSLDEELTENLRCIVRHLCANLARRCSMLDLSSLITEEVTSCCLRHLVAVFRADEISKALPYGDVETMRKEFFDLPCITIHEALKSREHESNYLLDLSSTIIPHIIPSKEIKCQSMRYLIEDLLSGAVLQPIADITPNPDIINHLLVLAFDSSHSKKLPEPSGVQVNLLEGLTRRSGLTSSCRKNLKMDLSAILKNQSALYSFMNFLKEENSINSIQFCLSVEDFNKRINTPFLNEDELDVLHSEAVNLFDTYLKRSSPYRVLVSQELIQAIRSLLMKPVSEIVQLRANSPLFNAYEEVYNYLESVMCPLFHKSEEYFTYLLGKRTEESPDDGDKSGSRGWRERLKSSLLRKMSGGKSVASPKFYVSLSPEEEEDADLAKNNNDLLLPRIGASLQPESASLFSRSADDISHILINNNQTSSISENNRKGKSRSLPRSSHYRVSAGEGEERRPPPRKSISAFFRPVKSFTNNLILHSGSSSSSRNNKTTSSSRSQSFNSKADSATRLMSSSSSRSKISNESGESTGSAVDLTDIYDEDPSSSDCVSRLSSGAERRQEFRDLSAWRLSIPRLSTAVSASKPHFVFVIDVQRIDMESRDGLGEDLHWSVKRRSSEFYALESKLTEFHGEFEDARLPAKSKLFNGKGLDSLQAKQGPFEEYLTKLIQKPSLKESDLLYTFLTSKEEFTIAASKLGKMIKNVKLGKEKGQSLQPFIDAFIASTAPGSPQPRAEFILRDFPDEGSTQYSILYGDNAEMSLRCHKDDGGGPDAAFDPRCMSDVRGVTDVFIYLCLRVFDLCKWKLQALMTLRLLVKNSLDHLVTYWISSKLRVLLSATRIAYLINLIDEAISGKESTQRTEKDKLDRQHLAQMKFQSYLSPYLSRFFGSASYKNGTQRIFMALQDPILNKQLFYQLLDVLVLKLIPEIQRPK